MCGRKKGAKQKEGLEVFKTFRDIFIFPLWERIEEGLMPLCREGRDVWEDGVQVQITVDNSWVEHVSTLAADFPLWVSMTL